MTKTIDALVEALEMADATLRGANMNRNVVERKITAALAQARAEQAEQAEPAAFVSPLQFEQRLVDPEGEFGTYIPMRKTSAGKFTQPLFTTPPAAPVAKLVPLPIENIEDLAEYHGLDHMTVEPFVRAVEAAHNAKLSK